MRNTTMLKHILQLYTLAIDIDEEDNFYVTMISKKKHTSHTIIDKTYSTVIGKAFRHMMKEIKLKGQERG
jgi:hypothetical protein